MPSTNPEEGLPKHRPCLSVYHECHDPKNDQHVDVAGWMFEDICHYEPEAYRVRRNRRQGGWSQYDGQERVIWEFSTRGTPVSDFIKLCFGTEDPLPSSYGMEFPRFTRLDVVADRPLSKIYQRDCRQHARLRAGIVASFDLVVHYFINHQVGSWAPNYLNAMVIRGTDYADATWKKLERAYLAGEKLPKFVLCAGSPVTCFDYIEMVYHSKFDDGFGNGNRRSHRWEVHVPNPGEWQKNFIERNGCEDPYGFLQDYNWDDAHDWLPATYDLLCPYPRRKDLDEGFFGSILLAPDGSHSMSFVLEQDWTMSTNQALWFFCADCGNGVTVEPAYGDEAIRLLSEIGAKSDIISESIGCIDYESYRSIAGIP